VLLLRSIAYVDSTKFGVLYEQFQSILTFSTADLENATYSSDSMLRRAQIDNKTANLIDLIFGRV
jgi:hypothetical protein